MKMPGRCVIGLLILSVIAGCAPMGESYERGTTMSGLESKFEQDRFATEGGDLEITFVGHGTLMFTFDQKVIHVDPVMREADYTKMPKGDLVLITHGHRDHLDAAALAAIRTNETAIVAPEKCAGQIKGAAVMNNGDKRSVKGIPIEAVPAYNIVHMRAEGVPYHPKGEGNGYVLAFGNLRVLVAGDTENVPEIKSLQNIDIAFLPMNLPYTMTPEMAADAAKAIRPKVLYPYHFGDTDTSQLVRLLADEKEIEVRIRKLD